ncbi:ABC transporter permease [Streptomyces fragilis]|uniref:ABC transporter permease n=1 Tax=Streptomyces fragilis TaxID=67301 RepID=A0ABV2YNW3_9ACTN|nr:ABC transporter permease [Streptomyces fragilis]
MSVTLRPPAPADLDDAPAPVRPPGGQAWAVLRLHRWALWAWTAYVALGAGLLLWAWGPAVNEMRSAVAACDMTARVAPPCATSVYMTANSYQDFLVWGFYAIFLAPILIGGWAAASLTGRELETGTAQLAWTQSVTPTRWLTTKLALPAVIAAAGTTLLLALYRLAHLEGAGPYRAIRGETRSWWQEDVFTATGVVMVPRVLCAVAVGVLLGLLLRRTLASLGTGLALMGAGTVAFVAGRHLLWPTEITYGSRTGSPMPHADLGHGNQHVADGEVTASGELVEGNGGAADWDCFDAARRHSGFDADGYFACLRKEGVTDVWTTYHPKSHFWPLQLVESGIWLAVATLAVFLSYRLLRDRTALREGAA